MNLDKLSQDVEDVSQLYSKRFKITRDDNWYVLKLQEEFGELVQSYLMMKGQGRAKNKTPKELQSDFAKELADVFCHVLLLSKHNNINLEKEIEKKWLVFKKDK